MWCPDSICTLQMSPYEAREKMAQICGRPSEYLDYRHFINWWATGQCAR